MTVRPLQWLRRLCIAPIRLYQRFLSPYTPPTCRFSPTCSGYAADAILSHGILKGFLLASWRILRCNPLVRGGYDPVPPRGRWRAAAPTTSAPDEE